MKTITALFLAFMVALISFPSVSNAASVGDRLTEPEAGWKRYDDSDSRIKYNGKFNVYINNKVDYNETAHGVDTYQPTSIDFKFVGTKLRIIYAKNNAGSKGIEITIDGVTETYSQYSEVSVSSTERQIVLYEKTGLSNTEHSVHIESVTGGAWGLDAFDIDADGYLVNISIGVPVLNASAGDEAINLNWTAVSGATGYNIKRSISANGPFETIAPSVTGSTSYVDATAIPGISYHYVVTAINATGEGAFSNVASAIIPVPDNGRAILVVTLTTGLEKEYDLSMQEVNDFINWYEAKQEGTGKASYAINKHDNNKGPFKSRKDYILFDRILTFEVSEY
jgi:hypothetical protein